MPDDYALTTGEVRRQYADYPGQFNQRARQFDAWLAEHDAQVWGDALREAADLLHSEARWQQEQHMCGRVGAQAISLRVSMMEQILLDRATAGAQP